MGLTKADAERFRIVRAIRDVLQTGQPQGFEAEILEEGRKEFPLAD